MIKEYLELGQIVSTHGIKGEVRFNPWCDSPRFVKKFKKLYFDKNGEKSIEVKSVKLQGNMAILGLDGVEDIDSARALKNKILYMKRSDANIQDGVWFISELIDCKVYHSETDKLLGTIKDVSETGANDVWYIETPKGEEVLIPAIKQVVISVDVVKGVIKINPIKGLFNDED